MALLVKAAVFYCNFIYITVSVKTPDDYVNKFRISKRLK